MQNVDEIREDGAPAFTIDSVLSGNPWSTALFGFKPYRAEAQSIGDDGKGTKTHRGAGDDRTEEYPEERIENTCGNRDAECVIDEGEEQVLLGCCA